MNHEERVQHLLDSVAERGAWRSTFAPGWLRFLWRRGIDLPPAPFLTPMQSVMWTGVPFGLFMGVLSLFGRETRVLGFAVGSGLPAAFAVTAYVAVGFGIGMCLGNGWVRRRYDLPDSWMEYQPSTDREAPS